MLLLAMPQMASDWADPYAIPGTRVLANKHRIRDGAVLRQFEYEQTALRIAELHEAPIPGAFDLPHLQAIHAHISQDVYGWAGEIRTVNLSKGGSSFVRARDIERAMERVAASLAKDKHVGADRKVSPF